MIHAEVREIHIGKRYDRYLDREVDTYSRQLVDTATGVELSPDQVRAAFADLQITGVCVKLKMIALSLSSGEWPGYGVIVAISHTMDIVTLADAGGGRRHFPLDVFRETYELD